MNYFVFLFVIALSGTCINSASVDEVNRIIDGSPAGPNQFPYSVSLQQISALSSITRGHRCGGALVTLQHVVTSASCLYNSINGVFTQLNPNEYRVFAGASVLTNDTSADRNRRIARFVVHDNYNTGTPFVNDIAVIVLADAFPSDAVGIVPMSTTDATAQQINACVSSGWGAQNSTAIASIELQYIQKTVYEQTACGMLYNSPAAVNQINIINSMICAAPLQIHSSCAGDIGNPLVCNGNLNGILIQGNGCTSIPTIPVEVYTRISSFRTWINNVTSGTSTFQPGMAVLALIALVQIVTANVLN